MSIFQYFVVNKSQNGFTIILNKNAPRNIRFSWSALAVRDAKVYESVMEGLVFSPVVTPDVSSSTGGGTDEVPPTETPTDTPAIDTNTETEDAPVVDAPVVETTTPPSVDVNSPASNPEPAASTEGQ